MSVMRCEMWINILFCAIYIIFTMSELVEITVNYQGTDVLLTVDLQTAEILLNDNEVAEKYAAKAIRAHSTDDFDDPKFSSTLTEDIWSTKNKNNDRDYAATLLFLELRAKYSAKFNDKKTMKNSLWLKISDEMRQNGYYIGDGKEAAEKCRQKFTNLQRTYLKHIDHMKSTGESKKNSPPFFNEMHDILGTKDKVNPPYVEDSLASMVPAGKSDSINNNDEESSPGPSTNADTIKNRFKSNTTVRPPSKIDKVMEQLKEQQREDRFQREEHFKILERTLEIQNQQRERLLAILESRDSKKRKTSNFSDSDE